MSKNIEMNYKTESGYEVVYPSVMVDNIGDLQSYLEENYYNKGEIDGNTWAVGDIRPSTRTDLSDDWHLCDGSELSDNVNEELYDILSQNFIPFATHKSSGMYNNIAYTSVFTHDEITGMEFWVDGNIIKYRNSNTTSSWSQYTFTLVSGGAITLIFSYNNNIGLAISKTVGINFTNYLALGTFNGSSFSFSLVKTEQSQGISMGGSVCGGEGYIYFVWISPGGNNLYRVQAGQSNLETVRSNFSVGTNLYRPLSCIYCNNSVYFISQVMQNSQYKLVKVNSSQVVQITTISIQNVTFNYGTFAVANNNMYYAYCLNGTLYIVSDGHGSYSRYNSDNVHFLITSFSNKLLSAAIFSSFVRFDVYSLKGNKITLEQENIRVDGTSSIYGILINNNGIYYSFGSNTIYSSVSLPEISYENNSMLYYIKIN